LSEDGLIQPIPQINITIDYETTFKDGPITNDSITGYLESSNIFLALKENYLMVEIKEENTPFEKENFEIEVFESGSVGEYTSLSFTPESETEFISSTIDNVEYFMNILTDDDIPTEVINELNINEDAVLTNASRVKINRNIYSTENEESC
jgi:hypothetical protein